MSLFLLHRVASSLGFYGTVTLSLDIKGGNLFANIAATIAMELPASLASVYLNNRYEIKFL